MSLAFSGILVTGTIGLVIFSWVVSIRAGRYHGVYRFFVFESLLILVLVNSGFWFKDPRSVRQCISWLLLAASAVVATHGFILLKRVGKPAGQMEETTTLIETGLYKYIRHPLYLSLILGGLGAFLKHLSWLSSALVLIGIAAAYGTAKVEEGELVKKFGADYEEYKKRTRMFVPFVV